jgi:hypothetical protein
MTVDVVGNGLHEAVLVCRDKDKWHALLQYVCP